MRFDIITIFSKIFDSYFNESILKRAQARKLIAIKTHDLREFTTDKHHKVDDTSYGGGAGMVFKIEPVYRAVQFLKSKIPASPAGRKNQKSKLRNRVILFSTRGKKLDASIARRLAKYDQLILICGRYEGVDERVAQHIADEEISVGDFVLSGGELPAMMLIEAVSRFIPGVLGKRESLEEIKGSYPVYTRPSIFFPKKDGRARPEVFVLATSKRRQATRKWKVPKVLLSGNHKKINEWRKGRRKD